MEEKEDDPDLYFRKQMEDFVSSLEITYDVTIYPFTDAKKEEKRDGFKIIFGDLPFDTNDQDDTHYILLLPNVIFMPGKNNNRAFFVSGPEGILKSIIKKMEFNAKVPARERVEDTSGLISKEDFDKMWGNK